MFEELRKRAKGTKAKGAVISRSQSKESLAGSVSHDPIKQKCDHIKPAETDATEAHNIVQQETIKLNDSSKTIQLKEQRYQGGAREVRGRCQRVLEGQNAELLLAPSEKKTFPLSDDELDSCQQWLAEQTRELDKYRQETAELKSENEAKQRVIEDLKLSKTQIQTELTRLQSKTIELCSTNDKLTRQISSLSEQLATITKERDDYEKQFSQQTSRLVEVTEELETLRSKLSRAVADHQARETDLRDQISLLEERLQVFASVTPGSAVALTSTFEDLPRSTDEESLQSSHGLAESLNSVPSDEAGFCSVHLGGGDVDSTPPQLTMLLRERDVLTARLETMRIRLAEVKAQWNDCLTALESQVTHLNQKITTDSEEHQKKDAQSQSIIKRLNDQVDQLRSQVDELNEKLRSAETQASERMTESQREKDQWEEERTDLLAQIAGLKEQATQAANDRDKIAAPFVLSEKQLENLRFRLKRSEENGNRTEKDLKSTQDSFSRKCSEAETLLAESVLKTKQLTNLRDLLEESDQRTMSYVGQLEQCQADLLAMRTERESSAKALQQSQSSYNELKAKYQLFKSHHKDEITNIRTKIEQKNRELQTYQTEKAELQRMLEEKNQELQSLSKATRPEPKQQFSKLQDLLGQKDQVIRLQQKRLKELRKSLTEQLKNQHLSDHDSVEGFSTEHGYHAGSFNPDGSDPKTGSTHSLPTFTLTVSQSSGPLDRPASVNNDPSPLVENAHISSSRTCPPKPDSHSTVAVGHSCNSSGLNEMINFRYLRHVIIKFLLSRESEAVHLVRVLATLLYLTAEEEKLLRNTLERRKSWFSARSHFSSTESHGQFAKMIPPSF
ncbi:unnamed protein product [Calicophoron daubneyi]|uniref:GRIP domain-containing protein n=1 Tax=Calicophoron daubneyi TaxID=300641 RepID=A0AAV2T175_CALDB